MELLPPPESPRWSADGSHIDVEYLAELASLHRGSSHRLLSFLVEQEILAEVYGEVEPSDGEGLAELGDEFLLRFYVLCRGGQKRAVRRELFGRWGRFDELEGSYD
jgi:hypothetical protein